LVISAALQPEMVTRLLPTVVVMVKLTVVLAGTPLAVNEAFEICDWGSAIVVKHGGCACAPQARPNERSRVRA
jgi:hypothetical protein